MKISSTGTISFVSEASIDYSPAPASAAGSWGVSDGFAFYDAAEDADGNLFVAARIARDLTVGQTIIQHHNTDGWNGDSQTTRGNGLILKLDKDGNYQSHLCSGGSATHDSFRDMLCKDGKLYLSGLVYGKEASGTLNLGDRSLQILSARNRPCKRAMPARLCFHNRHQQSLWRHGEERQHLSA